MSSGSEDREPDGGTAGLTGVLAAVECVRHLYARRDSEFVRKNWDVANVWRLRYRVPHSRRRIGDSGISRGKMLGGRRVRWKAAGLTVRVGAALISGAGLAAADSGDSIGDSSRTPSTSKLDTSGPDTSEPGTSGHRISGPDTAAPDTHSAGPTDKPRRPPASPGGAVSPRRLTGSQSRDPSSTRDGWNGHRRANPLLRRRVRPARTSNCRTPPAPPVRPGEPRPVTSRRAMRRPPRLFVRLPRRPPAAASGQDVAAVPGGASVRGNVPPADALIAAVVANLLSGPDCGTTHHRMAARPTRRR